MLRLAARGAHCADDSLVRFPPTRTLVEPTRLRWPDPVRATRGRPGTRRHGHAYRSPRWPQRSRREFAGPFAPRTERPRGYRWPDTAALAHTRPVLEGSRRRADGTVRPA